MHTQVSASIRARICQTPTGARLVYRAGAVVTRHPVVVPDAREFVVEAQDVHRVDLGDYCEPETPLRAVALSTLSDRLEEFGEFLTPTSVSQFSANNLRKSRQSKSHHGLKCIAICMKSLSESD